MPHDIPAPLHLMRAGLRWLPGRVLGAVLRRIGAQLPRRHPEMVQRLLRIAPGRYLFEPTDLAQRFLLRIGDGRIALGLAVADEAAEVTMRAPLATLIDLLEGRTDSDTALFARDIVIIGDMNLAVAFRNMLDGETVNLVDDALAQFGPLARPLGRVAERVHRRVGLAEGRLAGLRDRLHRGAHGGRDPDAEAARLRGQVDELMRRMAQLERRVRRSPEAA